MSMFCIYAAPSVATVMCEQWTPGLANITKELHFKLYVVNLHILVNLNNPVWLTATITDSIA